MSDRPERPMGERRPDPAMSARSSPPQGANHPAGTPADKAAGTAARSEPAQIPADRETAASEPLGEPPSGAASEPAAATANHEPMLTQPSAGAPLGEPPPMAAPARRSSYRGLALGLAAILLILLIVIGTAPLWVPWGDERSGPDPAIVERLDAEQQRVRLLEQQVAAATAAIPKLDQQVAAATAAMPRLEQRIGAVEQKPPAPSPELGEIRQQIAAVSAGLSDLGSRLERLANVAQAQGGGVSDLTARLDRAEQAQQAQVTELAAKLDPLQQGLHAQQSATAEIGSRLQAFDKTARSRAGDLTDMGLTLALLQLRNAVEAGRPFPAEYEALSSLAKARPEIAAAAAPLAAAAPTGTANCVVLAQELRAVAQKVEAATAMAGADDGWTGGMLDRLRGLVRIRRTDEAEPSREAEAAVTVAERALAGGDLARAVAAIETLQGPAATAAAEWLRTARERLAVEAALQRLEALLTARLGETGATPGSPG